MNICICLYFSAARGVEMVSPCLCLSDRQRSTVQVQLRGGNGKTTVSAGHATRSENHAGICSRSIVLAIRYVRAICSQTPPGRDEEKKITSRLRFILHETRIHEHIITRLGRRSRVLDPGSWIQRPCSPCYQQHGNRSFRRPPENGCKTIR